MINIPVQGESAELQDEQEAPGIFEFRFLNIDVPETHGVEPRGLAVRWDEELRGALVIDDFSSIGPVWGGGVYLK